ncbi:NUDIX hydrolase domain-like protein [Mrakia frigida]|uniref:NUDIX hydrolase n=1 Tax=Mrakia frigida TaxID=29902 RepID=UPI003FCC19A5
MDLPASLSRLLALPPPSLSPLHTSTLPRAGVLVALFEGRHGDLYVLLSRRSKELRTYQGDTALPGGKMEAEDPDIENTARREAWEEIGLPPDPDVVRHLCTLDPFLSRDNLLVTPVVVFITDNSIIPKLNTQEVTSLFSLPLANFLLSTSPFPPSSESHPPDTSEPYHNYLDLDDWGRAQVRIHWFLTNREHLGIKPVRGLTASILIKVASLCFGRPPSFELLAPGQVDTDVRIQDAVEEVALARSGSKGRKTKNERPLDPWPVVQPKL